MLSSRMLGTLVLLAGLAAQTEAASACVLEPTLLHRVDPELAAVDTMAPGRPVVVGVNAFRRSGLTCGADTCVQNSCGDTGTVTIDVAPTEDDQTPPGRIGYRLELVSGAIPDSMQPFIGVNLAGRAPLLLRPSFEQVAALDATLRAVAIDAAGNESIPSEPFAVQFAGCTLAAVGSVCEYELDPDSELSQTSDDAAADEPEVVPGLTADAASCSLPAVSGRASALTGFALAAALLGLGSRRRRQG